MPTSELQNYFKNELKPILERLDKQRKWVFRLTLLTILIVTSLILTWGYLPNQIRFGAILATIIIIMVVLSIYPKYRHKFRSEVVSRVISQVSEDFKYYPGEGISLNAFIQSGLYEMEPNKLNSNDYTEGRAGGIRFEFASVNARKLRPGLNGPAKNVSVFSGVFLHIELFHELYNQIYIVPNRSSLILGTWSQKNRFMGRGYLINTGHVTFDSLFAVYTYREDHPQLILDKSLLDALVGLSQRFGQEISVSFLNSGCYFSMTGGRELFNPRLIKSVVRFEDIQNIYNLIEAMPEIVTSLSKAVEE
ncbi:MAG: DUF3137 domain-containing protein [Roseivirga sp.]|nr:DUF3137 domain-containing protein [Roseivirga sp.]